MYMPHSHVHEEWLTESKAKSKANKRGQREKKWQSKHKHSQFFDRQLHYSSQQTQACQAFNTSLEDSSRNHGR